ncbi:ATP-binding cassette domain-containing protein [Proteinivorax tanatarense]|uniref:ATP-binding cassette domain-containing protein n=1 Tax=Proteinivorax tanatarense TaxID=1260629 RepID=A0AAU7VP67_9FIRM
MLEVKGLEASYDNSITYYKYPDFTLDKGKCLAIVGSTGCGKTTLLNSLFNPFFVGRAKYKHFLLLEKDISSYMNNIFNVVSFIPQFSQNALNPCLTISDHIKHMKTKDYNIDNLFKRSMKMLGQLKLEQDVIKKYPHQLSGGMKQRLILMLGFLKQPELVVLDEPSTAIDGITLKVILDFLKTKKTDGISMLIVTHDLGFVKLIADDVMNLDSSLD